MQRWLMILICAAASPIPATADQYGDFIYEVTPGNTVTISKYIGPGPSVVIPSTIASNSVSSIGSSAFYNHGGVTNVTIPNSITNIDNFAFTACSGLTSVTIPGSVTRIGTGVFDDCTSLASVTISNGVISIGDYAFHGCIQLTNVAVPASVTSVGEAAFGGGDALTNVTVDLANPAYAGVDGILFNKAQTTIVSYGGGRIGAYIVPEHITRIGDGAFLDCRGLTSVAVGDSVTHIDHYAFRLCPHLTDVTIGDGVTSIGNGAFVGCDSLTNVTVDAGNPAYSSVDGVLFNKAQTTLVSYGGGRVGAYTIPRGVISIGDEAFSISSGLESVVIPSSVSSIDDYAFYCCFSLTNITIGSGVTDIGSHAFYSCIGLTSVAIPSGVSAIGDYAFAYCDTHLRRIYFAGNAPAFGSDVFLGTISATLYYSSGAEGWSTTIGGRPAVLWNPTFTTIAIDTNGILCTVTGTVNIPVALEASTNLSSEHWTRLEATTLTGGSMEFLDPGATNHQTRFYRMTGP